MKHTIIRRLGICALLLTMTGQVEAGRVHQLSYQQLLDASDLVVIAEAESTQATRERITWGNRNPSIHAVGLSTTLRIAVVLKGDKQLHGCVVHHYRLTEADSGAILVDGPDLVSFDTSQNSDYLLFLKREEDGRYIPVTAPTASALSIFLIRAHTRGPN